MKYQAIIFDLDGVICHTDKYHYMAWKMLADKLGIYFDEQVNNRLRGVSRMESLAIIFENYDGIITEEEKIRYADEKNEIYKKYLQEMTSKDLSVEVKDTLQTLRNKGMKLAIGSSSKNAKFILNQIELGSFFDAISDGNNIVKSKPDPEVFLKAAEFIHIDPADCLVVEDAVAGVEASILAGMDCAALGDAGQSNRATYSLNNFAQLLEVCR